MDKLFGKHLEFRVRLFNIMAIAGIVISILSVITCFINGEGLLPMVASGVTTFIALGLLIYATRTGKYQRSYTITVVAIFLVFFPLIFLEGGGYSGAMPYYFIFAVIFTIFMLEGPKALIMAGIELACYIGLCLFAFYNPESITWLPTERAEFFDIVLGFTVVSIALGITMFLHFRLYNRQQKDLESARETALAASEAKSRFLANMSHEIRTPINIMLGMNEVIMRDSGDPHVVDCGRRIGDAGQMLLSLISNILDMAVIEKGKHEIKEEPYETAGLIASLRAIGEDSVRRRGLAFHLIVDESLPCVLFGDLNHLRQIGSNFLSNAAKYTERGTVTLSFSSAPAAETHGGNKILLRVAVADTGAGIKKEDIPFLFDSFTRADTISNKYIEGSGLGLAIAKEYAERMGGRIQVESEWGKGSVFAVEVEQEIIDPSKVGKWQIRVAERPRARTDAGGFVAPGCSVLIVDDNRENLQAMNLLLSRTLMRADMAESGAACIKAAKSARYDVILMDYMMPGMDGAETLRRLRELPGFDTPVLAVTANVVTGAKEKLLGEGFSAYLPKPVMRPDLEKALLAFLPEASVAACEADSGAPVSEEFLHHLSGILSGYGVELPDGLRYLGGNVAQYGKLASFFIENHKTGSSEISRLAEQNDWAAMRYPTHSLKSRARAMGANRLSATAAKLESLCETEPCDGEYMAALLLVLHMEWERARDGLSAFVSAWSAACPKADEPDSHPVNLEELLSLLKLNRQPDALDALERMIEMANPPTIAERLREIRQMVYEVEFREAERLLTCIMNGDRVDEQ
jgi:signal transduction histidine kinase/CheY-like chemotaxis protein/HPt (histidine-containing phosphotransfer) domain-containing protein